MISLRNLGLQASIAPKLKKLKKLKNTGDLQTRIGAGQALEELWEPLEEPGSLIP